MSTAAAILTACRAAGLKVAAAESCTGGLVAAALTEIAGSSAMFERGVVTYSNAAKQELLGVRAATLDRVGAVSPEVAREMAEGVLARSRADLAVSVTGIAGPGGSEHKPEGRVCFAIARRAGPSARPASPRLDALWSETVEFGALGRAGVRAAACEHALALLLRAAGDFSSR
ncbi:CinA family protein [Brevirhabdus sp.]|uniref:CinA family protein n=1 Tax=Brevirhabdus sp. TaxID=2004514 RepID=UPI00405A3F7B